MSHELTVEALYRVCDPSSLGCSTSEQAVQLDTIIGQERAVHALRFGLDIKDKGFHVYVSGMPGTGRTTATQRFLSEFAVKKPVPSDWCYVNRFQDPLVPNAIRLPAGKALVFKRDLERAIAAAIADLRLAFESDEYSAHKSALSDAIERQKQELLNRLGQQAKEEGFVLQATPMGLLSIPMREGQPISEEEYLKLSDAERAEINAKQGRLKGLIESTSKTARGLDKQLREQVEELDTQVARYAIQHTFEELMEKYADLEEIPEHIEHVREDILLNVNEFLKGEEEGLPALLGKGQTRQSPTLKYAVNVIVDNSELQGAPVVLEMNPTYTNLIGRVEHEAVMGALVTNFTLIRSGCLHRANGGFLVLPVDELLRNPFAWETLKRALANNEIVIEDIGERVGFSTKTLRPEPIPLDVKVILIGRPDLYQLLYSLDENFNELFKVKADFEARMPRSEKHIEEYLSFVCTLCCSENLKHLDQGALARIVEHASRLADDQEKMSALFGEMADVIREASYYANQEEAGYVSASHVERAIEERFYRSSLIHDRLQEMIVRDQIKISVEGEAVGQVNGLSVLSLGDISFGQPNRITASVGLGREGLIDIEREAELSGPIHTKGVLILSGYLAEKYTQDKPLSLSARLVFEQSYSGVEGDSASSAELYALLSALSGCPIRQGIAVTGSVNQKGQVQVIGGVNQKIEGFFEVCRARGLRGDQGVMIPRGNAVNLMLKRPVLEAVEQGKFHIWAVDTIDEGIEILTGVPAGDRLEDGSFTPGSIDARVDARLSELVERLERFGKDEKNE
jgi:lon-related putative ATP-dependent protease